MSLKLKITLLVVVFLVAGVFTVTITNLLVVRGKILTYAEGEMLQKVEKESLKLDNWFKERLITLQSIASNLENLLIFFDTNMIDMSLRSYVEDLQKLGFTGQILMSLDGKTFVLGIKPEQDLSKERFFRESSNGNIFIQDNVVFKEDRGLIFAVPVMSYSQEIIGVYAAFLPQKQIDQIIQNVRHGEKGYAFLTNAEAVVVSHPDENLKGKKISQVDENLKVIEEKILKRETSVLDYTFQGEKKMAAIANIPSVNWSIALTILRKEIEAVFRSTILMNVSIAATVAIVAAFVAVLFGRSIAKPIVELSNVAKKIAEGDLTQSIEVKRTSGEMVRLSDAFSALTNSLKNSIMNIKKMEENLKTLREQTQNESSLAKSVSDEAKALSENVNKAIDAITHMVQQVSVGSREIASGAEQTSKNALLLSESSKVLKESSADVEKAVNKLIHTVEELNKQQSSISESIQRLAEFTGKIEEVIGTIYSIAEQTNLLALNAAIEAARAGEAGRGFAVVAEEVRKLAEQSRVSTRQIGDFLVSIKAHAQNMLQQQEQITKRMNESAQAINESISALSEMIKNIEKVASMSGELAAISEEQSGAVEEINASMERIVKDIGQVSSTVENLSESVSKQSDRIESLSKIFEQLSSVFGELESALAKYRI